MSYTFLRADVERWTMKNEKIKKPTPITDAMEDAAEGVRRVTAIGPTTKAVAVVGSTAVAALAVAASAPAFIVGGIVGLGYTLTRRTRKPVEKCTACGAKLSVEDRFCRGCGKQSPIRAKEQAEGDS